MKTSLITGSVALGLAATASAASAPKFTSASLRRYRGLELGEGGATPATHTTCVKPFGFDPIDFGLPCGTIYEVGTDERRGIRWYDRETLTIVKRLAAQDAELRWSLSPDGAAPTVRVTIHANWRNPTIPDGDVNAAPLVYHGETTVSAPGYDVIAHIAGQDEPDGTHHGTLRFVDDPAVAAQLCRALGA